MVDGKVSTNCRTGTAGITESTMCAPSSAKPEAGAGSGGTPVGGADGAGNLDSPDVAAAPPALHKPAANDGADPAAPVEGGALQAGAANPTPIGDAAAKAASTKFGIVTK